MAMFSQLSEMGEREKILNVSYSVCAAFVIGDHLAFTAANAPELIAPMMVSKLVAGLIAVALALLFTRKMKSEATLRPNVDTPDAKVEEAK
jgi:ethanolamine transporter